MARQHELSAVLMRGGTSKGVFVALDDLPPAGLERDQLVLALLGSPDPMQIDGLGGTHSSTSKLMAVGPSERPDADVAYLFAQGAIDEPIVDYKGNCGNLTTAIGPYAIDEGLVAACEPLTTVRMHNLNTDVVIRATVPVSEGRAEVAGDCVVAGVPGSGAPISTDYLDPAGSVTGTLFPTGAAIDVFDAGWGPVEVSVVDVASPIAFVSASDVGLDADLGPDDVNADVGLLERLEAVRSECAALAGLADSPADATTVSPALPRLAVVSSPEDYRTSLGEAVPAASTDVRVRATSMQKMHHAYPMTAALCTAAAVLIDGTLPNRLARPGRSNHRGQVRIGHPKGVTAATAYVTGGPTAPVVESVGVTRTARRLFAGTAYVNC